jgi:hypothetical protein
MNRFTFLIAITLLAATPPQSASAEEAPPANAKPETRIEVDEGAGIIRFVVKGVEQARLTEGGFEVRNHLNFGGVLTDQGVENFGRTSSDREAVDAE